MLASDVMTAGVITISADADVGEAARTMLEKGVSGLPVVDKSARLIGIVSEGDLIRRVEAGTEDKPAWWHRLVRGGDTLAAKFVKAHGPKVSDVMTAYVITASPETPLGEIAMLMERNRIKRIPIVRQDKLVGIVSRSNLLQALATAKPAFTAPGTTSESDLRDRILFRISRETWAHPALLNIIVRGGVVDIWGSVASETERSALRILIAETPGVLSINDHLSTHHIRSAV